MEGAKRDQVVELLGQGLSSDDIARRLGMSKMSVAGVRAGLTKATATPAPTNTASTPSSGPRIFISYRRQDCQPQANGLNYGLCHRLPRANVFMDIDSIVPGEDFEQHIRREIEACDVVLALIGDNWLDRPHGTEQRRLDRPNDFVRIEIESALRRGVKLIPVLVEGAEMPRAEDLPESIRRLSRIHALELSDQRWTADMERLAGLIEGLSAGNPTNALASDEIAPTSKPDRSRKRASPSRSSSPRASRRHGSETTSQA